MTSLVALALAPSVALAVGGDGISLARATAIASALPRVRSLERTHPHSFSQVSSPVLGQWQVAFYSKDQEFVQVLVDRSDGHVIATYTGIQIAWTMARGTPGAFGRHVTSLYVWLPLCLLFLAPFFDWRSPLRWRNLDLLALTSLSISLGFFNHADINLSVPLAYPPLVYLLARLAWRARPRAARPPPLRLNFPPRLLLVGLVVLIAFRITLNVVDSNVIDVGFANVVGAQKVTDSQPLYGQFPGTIARGDTYGPVSYEAYVPFVAAFGFNGTWDSVPAAHAAAIAFDLLTILLLFLLGWRIRGPSTGIVLAYAWAAFPFTAYALESNSNDALVAALVTASLLVASSPPARGFLSALAGLTKYAPLALAPVLATYRLGERRLRGIVAFAVAFAAAAALALIPALDHNTLATIFSRSVTYQADRVAPFSLWGLYGGMHSAQVAVQALAVAFALGLALQRREEPLQLAAALAAILIAIELGVTYWFYLYIPWFFAPAAVAFLGGARFEPGRRAASEPRRWRVVWDSRRGGWLLDRPKSLLSGGRARAAR
ncbi:MAG TPA: glycosyltransferase 87 family protein [Solirubrobacteraceae bacterium]